jgi:hypothetical protein
LGGRGPLHDKGPVQPFVLLVVVPLSIHQRQVVDVLCAADAKPRAGCTVAVLVVAPRFAERG